MATGVLQLFVALFIELIFYEAIESLVAVPGHFQPFLFGRHFRGSAMRDEQTVLQFNLLGLLQVLFAHVAEIVCREEVPLHKSPAHFNVFSS